MWDWVEAIAQKSVYVAERSIAQFTWGFDRSGLSIIAMLDQFRQGLVTRGFTAALDTVAVNIMGVSRPVFELALVIGCFLVIASPIVRFQWVNLRKAIVLAFLIPVLLPFLAAKFQDLDAARGGMSNTFYNTIFERVDFTIGDGGGNGAANDMGPMVPFSARADGRTGLRGVDVAAAYLYATRDDVIQSRDLPAGFEDHYFSMTVEELGDAESAARWLAIAQGANGITRTLYGVALLGFALFESLTNFAFTLALGFLLIALLISILFAFFTPFEGMFSTVIKKLAELFMQSWAISAMQALLLAAVVKVATTSGGTMTLGMGVLGLCLQGVFTMMAYRTVAGSLTGFGLGGELSSFDIGRALRPATALAGGVLGAATAAPKAAMAYGAATRQGASAAFATGYALNASRPLAAVGALATAMGFGGGEFAAGGAQAQAARHRGQGVTSALGLHGVQQHVERTKDRAEAQTRQQTQEARYQQSEARRDLDEPQRESRRQAWMDRERQTAAEAPIRQLGMPEIAGALIGEVARRHPTTQHATGQSVAQALGLPPQAFGRHTAAVTALANTLHDTPIAPALAHQLLTERGLEGGFRPETWGQGMQALQDAGLSPAEATTRMQTLEKQMGQIPTAIAPDALAQMGVDAIAAPATDPTPLGPYQRVRSEGPDRPAATKPAGTRPTRAGAAGSSATPAPAPAAPAPTPTPSRRKQKRKQKKKRP